MAPLREEVIQSSPSFNQVVSSRKSKANNDEIRFLDYLGTDFSYLQRFILASEQMVRLVQTDTARLSPEVQSKLVETIEIAKDTLSEAGASARPFVACPAHLLHYREAYFNVLSASRSLVPYIEDPEVKLRLRRLLLPLTSTSCFHVVAPCDPEPPKADSAAPQLTRCDDADADTLVKSDSFAPGPSKPTAPRRKIRRASASAVLKFASSSTSYSSRASDSALRLSTGRTGTNPRRLKANPYPRLVVSKNVSRDSDGSPGRREDNARVDGAQKDGAQEDGEQEDDKQEDDARENDAPTTRSPSSPNAPSDVPTSEGISPELPISIEAPSDPKPTFPPIQYVSPQTPNALSLLQQQRRDFSAGYSAYQKSSEGSPSTPALSNCDWSAQNREGLSGIDCNIPEYYSDELPQNLEVFSQEEYESAEENFRKGLGWFPTSWRNERVNEPAPDPAPASPPELTWNARWDDTKQATPSSQVVPMLGGYPDDSDQAPPLSESTCIVM